MEERRSCVAFAVHIYSYLLHRCNFLVRVRSDDDADGAVAAAAAALTISVAVRKQIKRNREGNTPLRAHQRKKGNEKMYLKDGRHVCVCNRSEEMIGRKSRKKTKA